MKLGCFRHTVSYLGEGEALARCQGEEGSEGTQANGKKLAVWCGEKVSLSLKQSSYRAFLFIVRELTVGNELINCDYLFLV